MNSRFGLFLGLLAFGTVNAGFRGFQGRKGPERGVFRNDAGLEVIASRDWIVEPGSGFASHDGGFTGPQKLTWTFIAPGCWKFKMIKDGQVTEQTLTKFEVPLPDYLMKHCYVDHIKQIENMNIEQRPRSINDVVVIKKKGEDKGRCYATTKKEDPFISKEASWCSTPADSADNADLLGGGIYVHEEDGQLKLRELDLGNMKTVGSLTCQSVEKITGRSVTHLLPEAFKGCTELKSIYLPLVEDIPARAFYNCFELRRSESHLSPFRIPFSFGEMAFANCLAWGKEVEADGKFF